MRKKRKDLFMSWAGDDEFGNINAGELLNET